MKRRWMVLWMAALVVLPSAARADQLDDDLAAAKALLLAGKTDDAADKLDALEAMAKRAVAANVSDAHANYILGAAAMYGGHDALAQRALDAAVKLEPANASYLLMRGQLAIYLEKPKEAITWAQKVLDNDARNVDAWELMGDAQLAAKQWEAAAQGYQKAADLSAGTQKAKYLGTVGDIYQSNAENAKALEAYTQIIALAPDDWRSLAKEVQLYEALGKIPERDAARSKILALNKAGKVDAEQFCREQFDLPGAARAKTTVMVFEYFQLKGPMAVRYAFNFVAADGKTVEKRVSLEAGDIKAGERLFHMDLYLPNGHETLGMFKTEPTYEETREMVKKYIDGKLPFLSGITAGGNATAPATQGAGK